MPQTKHDENAEFDLEIESCVNQKTLLPAAFNASINRVNNHIRITVDYGGKLDYYEVNYKGLTCYAALGLSEPIDRKLEDAIRDCEK